MSEEIRVLNQKAEKYAKLMDDLKREVQKTVVGKGDTIEKLIIALTANGHVYLEGVPGLAKTLMIKTLADCINCGFVRIQFTPDLLPADITGTKIYEHKSSTFQTIRGPIFTNFVLADEINRAPAKVQSALLEAMQERQVSIQGETYPLDKPFFVLATQNPIESEGTYKLPEAQVDRFMFKLMFDYPSREEEITIMDRFTEGVKIETCPVIDSDKILEIQGFNQSIYADRKIKEYVADLVDSTRYPEKYGLDINGYIEYGASPRASLWLILGAKAHALLNGRGYVIPEDIKAVVYDVLRHRIIMTYEAEAEEIKPEDIITRIVDRIKVP